MRPNGLALGLHLGELLLGEAGDEDDGSGDDKGDCHTDDSPDGVHLATLQVVGEDQEDWRHRQRGNKVTPMMPENTAPMASAVNIPNMVRRKRMRIPKSAGSVTPPAMAEMT